MKEATLDHAAKILSVFKDTSEEQIQAILGSGLFADLRDGNIAGVNRDEFRRLLGLTSLIIASPKPPLFEMLGTIVVSAATAKFIARDKFVVNTGRKAAVKISYVWDNFKDWFLEKIEEPAAEVTLRYAVLLRPSVDGSILQKLGDTAEVVLAQMYTLMASQPNGEKGMLLTNGYANIFYVKDVSGVLRTVRVYWYGDGWNVYAHLVDDPSGCYVGDRVFSLNS